ncbi:hypothetical protein [Mucilaginibacter phyllosphaerae]
MRCKKYRFKIHLTVVLLMGLWCITDTYGQTNNSAIGQVLTNTQNYYKAYPAEKLYIKTDRPYYTVADTIWFKAWLFNAATYTPSAKSGKLYVELINDSSTVVTRFAIPLKGGLGYGQVVPGKQLNDGYYSLRAYTNWMQNFSNDTFFSKTIYIGKPLASGNWLINEQHDISAGNTLNLDVTLTNVNNLAVAYKDVELKLAEGNNTLFRGNYLTGDNGKLHSKITLPANTTGKQLYLNITDKETKNTFRLPFYPGGTLQAIDLQFMPESGNLVAGLPSKIGFKAIGQDGVSIAIQGIVTDSKGNQAGTFKSTHKGMGNFILLPKNGEAYTANYSVNGVTHATKLPPVLPEGIALKVDNLTNADSVLVHITASLAFTQQKRFTLLAQSTGGVYLGAAFTMPNGFSNMAFAKNAFVSGIVNFTVLSGAQPIARRKIFIDHHDRLLIDVEAARGSYHINDSIALTLNTLNAEGKPIKGSFAVSVTDNSLIKQDSLQDNIVSRLLLTSELRGNIEEPYWYFNNNDKTTAQALDNLMLTQGWTGFEETLFAEAAKPPKFFAEPDNSLTGRINGLFNKSFKNAKVSIFTVNKKHGTILIDTLSDANGRFKLRDLPLVDTVTYHIKATGLKGQDIGAKFVLDDFKPAPVTKPSGFVPMPWYAQSTDAAMVKYFSNPPQQLTDINPAEVKGRLLKQVNIKGTKPIDTKTYIPMIRKVINEQTLIEAGNTNLRDLLAEKFNSLYIKNGAYVINQSKVKDVIIDGQSLRETYTDQFMERLRSFLYTMPASEIKSIRIYDGFYPIITIETLGGTGLNTLPTPGLIVYHPIPYSLPMRFYNPRYKVSNGSFQSPRLTVYWESNLITDDKGQATLSFFIAKPGNYTVTIEGADMLGSFGVKTQTIQVVPPATSN